MRRLRSSNVSPWGTLGWGRIRLVQLTLGAVGAQQRGDVLLLRPLLARRRARRVRHRVEGDELARQRHQPITAGGNGFDHALLVGLELELHR